jgi:hypothetical protein
MAISKCAIIGKDSLYRFKDKIHSDTNKILPSGKPGTDTFLLG